MGLDMYLNKIVNGERQEVMYWRKANQVFQWFETHVSTGEIKDCVGIPVTIEQLKELCSDIEIVLANHKKARRILPTSEGLFFGSYEYGDLYYRQLEETRNRINELINSEEITEEDQLEFFAWW